MTTNQFHALCIGIAQYRHLPSLTKTTVDARDLLNLLAQSGYPDSNLIGLLDEQATKAAISDKLDLLARRAGPNDTVLIFFSGHGAQRIGGFEPGEYLCPVDADWYNLRATAISDEEFTTALRAIHAGRIVVFLDACHSGGVGEPKDAALQIKAGLSESVYARLAVGRGRVVIASCHPDEVSWELPRMRNGLFTHYLLEGLRGAAAKDNGEVRVLDLFDYVSRHVPRYKPQHPLFKGEIDLNFSIIVGDRLSLPSKAMPSAHASNPELGKKYEWEPDLVYVDAGPFWMGSLPNDLEASENEKPRRQLHLPAYWIGRYPVTNEQYAQFVQDEKYSPPGHWNGSEPPENLARHPVVNIDYQDVLSYCDWLKRKTGRSYRLPTEEEWEKAARGGLPYASRYPWGDDWRPDCCNTIEGRRGGTTPVDAFQECNRSPFGAVDMAGNVWEWTDSQYHRYPGSAHQSLSYGIKQVVRGGSWNNSRDSARVSCRGRYPRETRRPYLGFRVAVDIEMEEAVAEAPDVVVEGDRVARKKPRRDVDVEGTVLVSPRQRLYEKLTQHFSKEELQTLCFNLKVDYDDLPAQGKAAKARELILYLERRGRLDELIDLCRLERPGVSWYGLGSGGE